MGRWRQRSTKACQQATRRMDRGMEWILPQASYLLTPPFQLSIPQTYENNASLLLKTLHWNYFGVAVLVN